MALQNCAYFKELKKKTGFHVFFDQNSLRTASMHFGCKTEISKIMQMLCISEISCIYRLDRSNKEVVRDRIQCHNLQYVKVTCQSDKQGYIPQSSFDTISIQIDTFLFLLDSSNKNIKYQASKNRICCLELDLSLFLIIRRPYISVGNNNGNYLFQPHKN